MEQQPRTRKSQIIHDREYKREILAPIYAFLALSVGGTIAVAILSYFDVGDISVAADISMIWLTLLLIIVAAILIAVMVMAIGGMSELLNKVDEYAGVAQYYVDRGNDAVRRANKKFNQPLRKVVGLLDRFRGEE